MSTTNNIVSFMAKKREIARHKRINDIVSLLVDDVDIDAYYQLENHCLDRRYQFSKRAKQVLIEKGILAKDGMLTDLTNEAMYTLRTGEEPFWLQQNRL